MRRRRQPIMTALKFWRFGSLSREASSVYRMPMAIGIRISGALRSGIAFTFASSPVRCECLHLRSPGQQVRVAGMTLTA
jgi:hypothetical protein